MNLICPRCMSEAVVRLDLDDGDTLTCHECDESYTVAEVDALVAGWTRLLPWLLTHPARTPVPTTV